jgi:hypothetical protein
VAIAKRFVAICDVLGCSQLVKTTSLETLCTSYRALLERARPRNRWVTLQELSGADAHTLRFGASHVVFSDTILLWSDPHEWSVQALFGRVTALITEAMALSLPLRVGVAFGECEIDIASSIYVGSAIIDAHQTEAAQLWVGGACHPSCGANPWFRYYVVEEFDTAVEYEVPTRPGTQLGMALNWVNPRNGRPVSAASLRECLHDGKERAMSTNGRLKWDNASTFCEWQHTLAV